MPDRASALQTPVPGTSQTCVSILKIEVQVYLKKNKTDANLFMPVTSCPRFFHGDPPEPPRSPTDNSVLGPHCFKEENIFQFSGPFQDTSRRSSLAHKHFHSVRSARGRFMYQPIYLYLFYVSPITNDQSSIAVQFLIRSQTSYMAHSSGTNYSPLR